MWLAIFVKASVDALRQLRTGHCICGDSLTSWARLRSSVSMIGGRTLQGPDVVQVMLCNITTRTTQPYLNGNVIVPKARLTITTPWRTKTLSAHHMS